MFDIFFAFFSSYLKKHNEYLKIKHADIKLTKERKGKWVITIFRYINFTK